jgi:Holliday junction resolvasome RuvABC ATP-dependent DNA helicase subunit
MSGALVRPEIDAEALSDERRLEAALRPRTLDDFVGQCSSPPPVSAARR